MTTTALHSPARVYPSLRAAWIPLAALCLAFFVEMVDNTLLSIALPTIGRDLGSGTTALQWVTGAYSLTFGGLLLTAGSMADRFGRRRVLLIGLAVFGSLSLCVVLVTTAGELIALRAALGIAAAAMAPITNSLVFRLFDDKALRMRAMTVMIVVGMSGFVLGPLLGGTALAHVRWEWLLVVNAPIALIACVGVRLGVAADRTEDLTKDALDVPGAVLSVTAIGLACYSLTSGVEHGWLSTITLVSIGGAVAAAIAFVLHERRSAAPMLDLGLFTSGTVRGRGHRAGRYVHRDGRHHVRPDPALPVRLRVEPGTGRAGQPADHRDHARRDPLSEWLGRRFGHRIACLVGAACLAGSLAGLSWGVDHGYGAIAVCMVIMTVGLRTVMTICAVALVDAMPANRTSIGAALNDTAQEVGTSIGTAVVGTLIAALVTTQLPAGTWSHGLVASFFHGERVTYGVLAVVVGLIAAGGALSLTDSHSVEEHPDEDAA